MRYRVDRRRVRRELLSLNDISTLERLARFDLPSLLVRLVFPASNRLSDGRSQSSMKAFGDSLK